MKFAALKRVLKHQALIFGGAMTAGALVGAANQPAGSRADGAQEGALTGAGIAGLMLAAKSKTVRQALSEGSKAATKVIFRRIGGKLRPIRVK